MVNLFSTYIEQAGCARHSQDKAVGLNNLAVDTVHVVTVAGIGGQILKGIMIIDKSHSETFEAMIPNKPVILQLTEAAARAIVKRLPDLLLQEGKSKAALWKPPSSYTPLIQDSISAVVPQNSPTENVGLTILL